MGEVSAGDGSRSPSLSSIALPLIVFSERLGLNCRCNDPLSVFFWLSPAVVSVDVNFAICVNHYGNCIELCTLSLSNSPVTVRCFASACVFFYRKSGCGSVQLICARC